MKPLLIVTTLLSGEGPTGVETHFNHVIGTARARGWDTALINPYSCSRLARAPYRPLKNLKSERARVLYRQAQAFSISREVRKVLARNAGRRTTIYAQCPLMAAAALKARRGYDAEVTSVIHFNVSEADEFVKKGLIANDAGPLGRHFYAAERSLAGLDRLACGSNYMLAYVNARVPALRAVPQVRILNSPAEPDAQALAEARVPGNALRDLIAIGTLEPRKNQAFLLRVLAEARELGRGYTLTIAGDGPDRRELEALTASLGLLGQVNFAGFDRRASLLIPKHRVLVHAAKAENCPLTVGEALAYGRPVFAAAVGGIPEMYAEGVEGHFWSLDDPRAGAQALIGVLENPQVYARMSAAARSHYEKAFLTIDAWMAFLFPELETRSSSNAVRAEDAAPLSTTGHV